LKIIRGMCRAKLDIYVFIDFPVFIPCTHQMKVIPGVCRAKLDSYVFIDFPLFRKTSTPHDPSLYRRLSLTLGGDESYYRDGSCGVEVFL
jgi:hypothetical protein